MTSIKNSTTIMAYNAHGVAAHQAPMQNRLPQLAKFTKQLVPGVPVLDAGCGTGKDVRWLREARLNAFGIDAAFRMIDFAKASWDISPWISVMSLDNLSFPDNMFSGIWCRAVYLHMTPEDVKAVTSELFRVMAPGGRIFIRTLESVPEGQIEKTEPFNIEISGPVKRLKQVGTRFIRTYQQGELAPILKAAGFYNIRPFVVSDEMGKPIKWLNIWAEKQA